MKSFVKYTDLSHGNNKSFKEGDEIAITTKLNGIHARFGWHKYEANTWWKKILRFFCILPTWVYCIGNKDEHFTNKNVGTLYYQIDKEQHLHDIPKGFTLYGEIIGDKVKTGWKYDYQNQQKFLTFDVRDNVKNRWLNHREMVTFCDYHGIDRVPIQFVGHHAENIEQNYIDYNPLSDEVNEGVVVKPTIEQSIAGERQIFKYIHDGYKKKLARTKKI